MKLSCHVIVWNRLCLSMGSWGVAAGVNPSLVSGRGQDTPWTSCQLIAGPSLMSKVRFSTSLKDTLTCSSALPGAGIWTGDILITGRPALPAELHFAKPIQVMFVCQLNQTISTTCSIIFTAIIFLWWNERNTYYIVTKKNLISLVQ